MTHIVLVVFDKRILHCFIIAILLTHINWLRKTLMLECRQHICDTMILNTIHKNDGQKGLCPSKYLFCLV